MGESAIGTWIEDVPVEAVSGEQIKMIDVAAATRKADGALTVSAVNKHDVENRELELVLEGDGAARKTVTVYTLNGASKDSYNDIDSEQVGISVTSFAAASDTVKIELPPHSVNMIVIEE
jgi:alpha-N-arabinofuranosidase